MRPADSRDTEPRLCLACAKRSRRSVGKTSTPTPRTPARRWTPMRRSWTKRSVCSTAAGPRPPATDEAAEARSNLDRGRVVIVEPVETFADAQLHPVARDGFAERVLIGQTR